MKEPDLRARPAFDEARNDEEHRRQQRLAALSPNQREALARMQAGHEAREQDLAADQKQRFPGEVAARTRQNLLPDPGLHNRPEFHGSNLRDANELSHAVEDYLNGRESRAVSAYRLELNRAHGEGKRTVTREHGLERGKLRQTHQRERDGFLTHAERARGQSVKEPFRQQANKQRPTKAFEKAARDPSYRRAFDRAAQKDNQLERDHERARGGTRPGERPRDEFANADRDPSRQRAFAKAARSDPANRDDRNRKSRDGRDLTR